MSSISHSELDAALAPLRQTLEADGYTMNWILHDDAVDVRIEAGPEACEDCLVPPPVLGSIIRRSLNREEPDFQVRLTYPGD